MIFRGWGFWLKSILPKNIFSYLTNIILIWWYTENRTNNFFLSINVLCKKNCLCSAAGSLRLVAGCRFKPISQWHYRFSVYLPVLSSTREHLTHSPVTRLQLSDFILLRHGTFQSFTCSIIPTRQILSILLQGFGTFQPLTFPNPTPPITDLFCGFLRTLWRPKIFSTPGSQASNFLLPLFSTFLPPQSAPPHFLSYFVPPFVGHCFLCDPLFDTFHSLSLCINNRRFFSGNSSTAPHSSKYVSLNLATVFLFSSLSFSIRSCCQRPRLFPTLFV